MIWTTILARHKSDQAIKNQIKKMSKNKSKLNADFVWHNKNI